RCEKAVDRNRGSISRDELLDLLEDPILDPAPPVGVARQLHEPGPWDARCEIVRGLDVSHWVPCPVQHQGRDPDRRQNGPHIDLPVPRLHGRDARRARSRPCVAYPPCEKRWVYLLT